MAEIRVDISSIISAKDDVIHLCMGDFLDDTIGLIEIPDGKTRIDSFNVLTIIQTLYDGLDKQQKENLGNILKDR